VENLWKTCGILAKIVEKKEFHNFCENSTDLSTGFQHKILAIYGGIS